MPLNNSIQNNKLINGKRITTVALYATTVDMMSQNQHIGVNYDK